MRTDWRSFNLHPEKWLWGCYLRFFLGLHLPNFFQGGNLKKVGFHTLGVKGFPHAHLEPIWYHSKHSDIPYSPEQFLGWDIFCRFLHANIILNSNLNCFVCSQMNPKVPTTRQFAHDAFFTMTASLQAAAVEIGLCWAWSNGYLPMRDYS